MHRPPSIAESTVPARSRPPLHGRLSLVLAAAYFLFGQASFLVQVDDVIVTPVLFAPEGIALAMALRFGAGVWPGVLAGQLLLALSRGLAFPPSFAIAAANSAEVVLAVLLFRAFKLEASLPGARDLAGLLLLVFLVLQPFSATLGTVTLQLAGVMPPGDWPSAWIDWWIGNSLGQMLVAPLLLALLHGARTVRETTGDFLLPLVAVGVAFAVADYLLRWTGVSSLVAVLAPIFVLLAVYRGLAAVCVGGLLVAAGAIYATSHALGPFVAAGRADLPGLNLFIIGLAVTGQFLAVFLQEVRRQQELAGELRDARQRLQRTAYELTENIPVGTYTMVQPPGGGPARFSFMSTRFLELTGLERSAAEADPMNAFACVHPEDHAEWVRRNAFVFEHKLPFKGECRVVVRGETRWITAESTPRRLPDGSTVWEGVLTDITDRKLAEEKLAAAHRDMQLTASAARFGFWELDVGTGLDRWDDEMARIHGIVPGDFDGHWEKFVHPEDHDEVMRETRRMLDSEGVFGMDYRIIRADRAARHVREYGIVTRDAAGRAVRVNGLLQDITEQQNADEEFRRTAQQMRLAASAAGIGFWSRDLVAGLEEWDDQMLEIYGVRRGDFNGRWEPFVHPADLGRVRELTDRAVAQKASGRYEYRIIRPDGSVRHLRGLSVVVLDRHGTPVREIGVNFDITEEKEAAGRERQLEEDHRRDLESKLKTSLAASAVAHEINQPLSAILLQSKMALQQEGDTRGALRIIAEEAQRVVATIDKMKTLLRNVQTEHRAIDLTEVARSALLYNKGLLARHRIEVRVSGFESPLRIMGDAAQLQLVLTNLLRNAAEAIAEAGPAQRTITVDVRAGRGTVELLVGDSGPGWPPGGPAEEPLRTTKKAGTGIGLYVVRTAMQNHRGGVAFGTSPLGGAEVRLTFPGLAP